MNILPMPQALPEEMGLDEESVRRRREFLSFGPEDMRRVSTLAGVVHGHVDELTDTFFGYLARFHEAEPLLGDPVAVDRARQLKRAHLLAMVEGPYGPRYARQRAQLALVYSEAGLHHYAFLGAFHHLMSRIAARVMHARANDMAGALQALESLEKVALFDIGLILDVLSYQRQVVIEQQQSEIRSLSTPVLKLRPKLLLVPLVGLVNAERASQLTDQLLQSIPPNRAKVAVLDITGAASVDAAAAGELVKVISKAKMMGTEIVVTGVSADMAKRLVELGVDLTGVRTIGDLQGGIEQAEHLLVAGGHASPRAASPAPNDAGASNKRNKDSNKGRLPPPRNHPH